VSSSRLGILYKTRVTWRYEFKNSWGTAPCLWDWIYRTYIDPAAEWLSVMGNNRGLKKVWGLLDDYSIPVGVRAALLLTLDRAVILREHVSQVAWPIYNDLICAKGFSDRREAVNHWAQIQYILVHEGVAGLGIKIPRRGIGVVLDCTSVADVWGDYPRSGIQVTSEVLWRPSQTPSPPAP